MPERSGVIVHAQIDAFLRGVEFGGEGTIELVGEALGLTVGKRRALVAFSRLDGLREGPESLELFADTGDTIAMYAPTGLDMLARAILTSAHALPELTRSLRGLGSHRARPDEDHDRFFAPFISARARAERTSDSTMRLEAFNAARLRDAVERQVLEFARLRYPDRPPDRRATEAILGECTDDVVRNLERLEVAAAAVRASPPEVQLARWRAWRDAVHAVIDSADRCWFAIHPVLRESGAPPKRRWWRRLRFGAALAIVVPTAGQAQHVTLRVDHPERVVMSGLAGRAIVIEFVSQFFSAQSGWWLDEILVAAHGAAIVAQADGELRPSTNPVRSSAVHLTWPFGNAPGEVRVFDFAGRPVWRTPVQGGAITVTSDIASAVRNGVYIAVARSEGRVRRLKLFVARGSA